MKSNLDKILKIFQNSSLAFFLSEEGALKILHAPSDFVIPHALREGAEKLHFEIQENHSSEGFHFLDFSLKDFKAQGKILYGLKQSKEAVLLVFFDFHMDFKIDSPRICDHFSLTAQECRVTELVLEGLSNDGIAYKLGNSTNTVRVHLQNIFQKTRVGSRLELFKRMMELLAPGDGALLGGGQKRSK